MRIVELLNKLSQKGYLPGDSIDVKIHKSSLTILSIPFAFAGLIWGTIYFSFGLNIPGSIPFTYGILSLLSFARFLSKKKYTLYRNTQLILILLLPFFLQLSLGGFVPSSAVILWSFISPMGALVFLGARKATRWYLAFILLVVLAYFLNDYVSQHFNWDLNPRFIRILFVLNIIAVSAITYSMLAYYVNRQALFKKEIQEERDRSDELLLNILPYEIAEELKQNGLTEAKDYENVTILFTDFKDFTRISEQLSAQELVHDIDYCFKAFDQICDRYGIEKIKTIGDAYMAAGGIPIPSRKAVSDCILAALDMAQFILQSNQDQSSPFQMRVGIHTGPVVAGIVGVKKFQYDLWGDTVNTASRMESNGAVGKVNISQTTYELVKDDPRFAFQYRGKVEAKGKGEVDMYYISLH
jgi:guanylate cyclase